MKTITKTIIASLVFCGAVSSANSAQVELLGNSLNYYTSFSIDKTHQYSLDNLPKDAIGLYGTYAVYENSSSLLPKDTLAFMRKSDNLVGAIILNSIDYKCKNKNPHCYPLASLDEEIIHYELKNGFHRVEISNIKTWLEAYQILSKSKEIKKFSPSFDLGSEVKAQ